MTLPSRDWRGSFEASAYQSFLAGLKTYWGGELYRDVVARAEAVEETSVRVLEENVRADPSYRLYSWLERRIQQLKWQGRYGFATMIDAQRDHLAAHLRDALSVAPDRLRLDPSVALPDYVTAIDTHQQPGGLWRDPLAAYALAWYATGLSFAGTNPDELVEWYAKLIVEHAAAIGLKPRTIIDLGCTGGRSTRAIKRAIPAAELIGCDVCPGPLTHGHLRSIEENCVVTLMQCSAEALPHSDASVDVVASHWLYHEMPPAAIRRSITEAGRVLRPGGLFAAYDMVLVPGGMVGRWLQSGYAARNNEPFAHTLTEFDFSAELTRAGFTGIRIELTGPQHPDPTSSPPGLPPRRLHYMTIVSAQRPSI